jgi:hypothetical protein
MKLIRGDLVKLALDSRFEVIIHGGNYQCVMGAGIARTIKHTFPEAYKADEAGPKGETSSAHCSLPLSSAMVATTSAASMAVHNSTGEVRVSWRTMPKAIGLPSPLLSTRSWRTRITPSSNTSGDEDRCFGGR